MKNLKIILHVKKMYSIFTRIKVIRKEYHHVTKINAILSITFM